MIMGSSIVTLAIYFSNISLGGYSDRNIMMRFMGVITKKGVTESIMRKLLSLIMLCTILLRGVSAKSYGLNEKNRTDHL